MPYGQLQNNDLLISPPYATGQAYASSNFGATWFPITWNTSARGQRAVGIPYPQPAPLNQFVYVKDASFLTYAYPLFLT